MEEETNVEVDVVSLEPTCDVVTTVTVKLIEYAQELGVNNRTEAAQVLGQVFGETVLEMIRQDEDMQPNQLITVAASAIGLLALAELEVDEEALAELQGEEEN